MHLFSLFSASKSPEKWLYDAICRKKQLSAGSFGSRSHSSCSFTIWLLLSGSRVSRSFPQRPKFYHIFPVSYTHLVEPCNSPQAAVEQLYNQFNNNHPADYHHPSMSVSDIVAIKQAVITPSLETLRIASAINLPIVGSLLAETAATCSILS